MWGGGEKLTTLGTSLAITSIGSLLASSSLTGPIAAGLSSSLISRSIVLPLVKPEVKVSSDMSVSVPNRKSSDGVGDGLCHDRGHRQGSEDCKGGEVHCELGVKWTSGWV